MTMEIRPMKRSCPSERSVSRLNASRQARGATSGRNPSSTSTSAHAARNVSGTAVLLRNPTDRYFARARGAPLAPPPDCFRYWKNSELGSSTMMSLLFRNVALYVSRLR